MKILLATYWSIPHLGGVWNYLSQLKSKLEQCGHEADILGYGGDNTFVQMSGRDKTVPKDRWMSYMYDALRKTKYPQVYQNTLVEFTEFQRYIYELAAAEYGIQDYDVIHTHDVISTVAINRIKPDGIPLIATLHGLVSHEIRHQLETIYKSDTNHLARAYFDKIEQLGATSADITIVANDWLRSMLQEDFQIPESQFEKVHYGFDVESYLEKQQTASSIHPPAGKKVIMYAGRLIELKGVDYLIHALAQLKQREDWVCWIVGDGKSKQVLQQQVAQLQLGNRVLFFGKRDDIAYLTTLADICVLPSLMDNQPLSVIEAQISGKAAIVTDAGGLPEMVDHGVTGLVVPRANIETLSAAITTLLNDDAYRNLLGQQAKAWGIQHWSMENGVNRLLEIYQHFIALKQSENME